LISTVSFGGLWERYWILRYGFALAIVFAGAELGVLLGRYYGVTLPYITFYPAVMLVAAVGGQGAGSFATLLSTLYTAYFFLDPRGHLRGNSVADAVGLTVFCAMGLVISAFAGALRRARRRERMLIEQALRDSEAHFHLVVEEVEDYAVIMLDRTGRVVGWNAGAERIKGWPASEIIGQHVSCFFPEEAAQSGRP
jgi:K+-sensing histidine kinase KdpD